MKKDMSRYRRSVIARAIFLACSGAALTVGVSPTVFAQTNATGTIYGQATAGATIVMVNKDDGSRRTVTADGTGRYSAPSLPTGNYKVDQVVGGQVTKSTDNVEVRIGQGSEVSFAGTSLQTVQVTGTLSKIDVSSIGSTTIFTASDLARVPVARDGFISGERAVADGRDPGVDDVSLVPESAAEGLPATDPVRFGAGPLAEAIIARFQTRRRHATAP